MPRIHHATHLTVILELLVRVREVDLPVDRHPLSRERQQPPREPSGSTTYLLAELGIPKPTTDRVAQYAAAKAPQ